MFIELINPAPLALMMIFSTAELPKVKKSNHLPKKKQVLY